MAERVIPGEIEGHLTVRNGKRKKEEVKKVTRRDVKICRKKIHQNRFISRERNFNLKDQIFQLERERERGRSELSSEVGEGPLGRLTVSNIKIVTRWILYLEIDVNRPI